jgi:hypothetical protein
MGSSPLRGRGCPQADTQEKGDEDKNYPQEGMEWLTVIQRVGWKMSRFLQE